MRMDPHAEEVARLAAQLEREHPIRMQMLGVVTLASLAGFLTSFTLLHVGLTNMAIRYAIATGIGYGVFVWCVRVWLLGRDASAQLHDDGHWSRGLNLNVFGRAGRSTASPAGDTLFSGGRSGGAGASASFASSSGPAPMFVMPPPPQSSGNGLPGLDKVKLGSSKKGAAAILVIALIVIGLAVVGRVVWQSPNLLAEMLVDGAVAGSAFRGVQRAARHRELDVVRHTWVPALIVLVVMVAIGAAAQYLVPQAVSIGDVFR